MGGLRERWWQESVVAHVARAIPGARQIHARHPAAHQFPHVVVRRTIDQRIVLEHLERRDDLKDDSFRCLDFKLGEVGRDARQVLSDPRRRFDGGQARSAA